MLLDWGDSGVGHPLLDQPAFLDRIAAEHVPAIRAHWDDTLACRRCRAATRRGHRILLAPVAAARQAVIYQKFLDNIEPSERVYHRGDPADWLRRTAGLLREER